MAKVSFKIISDGSPFTLSENPDDLVPAYNDGQIIFVEAEKKIYLDFHNARTCYASGTQDATSNLKYIGQLDETGFNPFDSTTWKMGGSTIDKPNINDMAVVGTKEYLYRQGKDKNGNPVTGWFEIGDEESPTWNE